MRCITRIHLSDCGWHEAYYPGTTVHLADPRTGEPAHTVFSLEQSPPRRGGLVAKVTVACACGADSVKWRRSGQTRPTVHWRAQAPVLELGPSHDRLLSLMARLAATSFERLRIAVWFLPGRIAT